MLASKMYKFCPYSYSYSYTLAFATYIATFIFPVKIGQSRDKILSILLALVRILPS